MSFRHLVRGAGFLCIISEYIYTDATGNTGAKGEESVIHPHSGDGGIGVVSNINNLLAGHNFESLSSWSEMPSNCGDIYISNYANVSYTKFGMACYYVQFVSFLVKQSRPIVLATL